MVCRQHASAAKVKCTSLTTYSYKYLTNYYYMIKQLKLKVHKSLKFGSCGRDWHPEHGHRKWRVQLLVGSKYLQILLLDFSPQ